MIKMINDFFPNRDASIYLTSLLNVEIWNICFPMKHSHKDMSILIVRTIYSQLTFYYALRSINSYLSYPLILTGEYFPWEKRPGKFRLNISEYKCIFRSSLLIDVPYSSRVNFHLYYSALYSCRSHDLIAFKLRNQFLPDKVIFTG